MPIKGSIDFNAKEQSASSKKLDELLTKKKVLYQISATYPFQLSPDQLIIDTQKVTILTKQLFGTTTVETILLDSIGDLDVDVSFLFAALKILSLSHERKWLEITHLQRNEAIKAKRIIEGLLIAKKENINLDEIEEDALAQKLEKLGSSN